MSTATKRVLPADVYDALAASAEMYGGIGYGVVSTRQNAGVPVCILGHCRVVDGQPPRPDANDGAATKAVVAALTSAGIWIMAGEKSDAAVKAINRRNGTPLSVRVSFAEWCAELGVERGS